MNRLRRIPLHPQLICINPISLDIIYDDNITKYVSCRGEDYVEKFIEYLENDVQNIYDKHLKHVMHMIPLTAEEEENFRTPANCIIFDTPLHDDSA